METKHTPGPWHPVNYGGHFMIQTGPYYDSADILDENQTPHAEQNAKLIAAAPQLLEALVNVEKRLTEMMYRFCDSPSEVDNDITIKQIRSAIKSATE